MDKEVTRVAGSTVRRASNPHEATSGVGGDSTDGDGAGGGDASYTADDDNGASGAHGDGDANGDDGGGSDDDTRAAILLFPQPLETRPPMSVAAIPVRLG